MLDTKMTMAFAMRHHPRLGEGPQVQVFDIDLVQMILDYAEAQSRIKDCACSLL
jgi:hypothetical protein